MIDALFGSKTRVKLLHLFLNNVGQPFYVREITRKIDEQINSVRRELANMLDVGIIVSESVDNRLYYQTNQKYEYFVPLRAIFSDTKIKMQDNVVKGNDNQNEEYEQKIVAIPGVRLAIFAGHLINGSMSNLDIILAGDISAAKVKSLVENIEKKECREISYCVLSYDEFYYRLSVRDKFITDVLSNKHKVVIDTDKVLGLKK
jgi:predicted transcriptional regulator